MIDSEERSACIYRDGELFPLEFLLDETSFTETESTGTQREFDQSESGNEVTRTQDSSEVDSEAESLANSRDIDFGTFVEECVVEEEDREIPKDELYEAYQAWATAHAQKEYSKPWFGRKLSEHITFDEYRPTHDGERVRYYTGITLSHHGRTFLE